MRVTQKDIAVAANVSQALVSTVLSGSLSGTAKGKNVRVSAETRAKVIETAERLGYRFRTSVGKPKVHLERTLLYLGRPASKREMDLTDDGSRASLQNALIEAACEEGCTLKVHLFENMSEILPVLERGGMDGMFLCGVEEVLPEEISRKIPVIFLGGKGLSAGDVVMINHQEVISRAVEYLHGKGHRHVALVGEHPDEGIAATHWAAFRETSAEWGIQGCEDYGNCRNADDFMGIFLNGSTARPTAMIANDALALSIQQEALRNEFSLVNDLSMVGLGNSPAAAFHLTSVDFAPGEISRVALSLMGDRIEKGMKQITVCRKIEISPTIIERSSVSCLIPETSISSSRS